MRASQDAELFTSSSSVSFHIFNLKSALIQLGYKTLTKTLLIANYHSEEKPQTTKNEVMNKGWSVSTNVTEEKHKNLQAKTFSFSSLHFFTSEKAWPAHNKNTAAFRKNNLNHLSGTQEISKDIS